MLAYFRLLWLNKIKGYDPRSYRAEKGSRLKNGLRYLGFAVLALYLYGLLVFMEVMLFRQVNQLGQGQAVLALAFLGCTAVTLIYGFFTLSGNLFFGLDIGFVSALPLSSTEVLTVKSTMTWLGEAGISLLFCAPLVICVGATTGVGVLFYLKALAVCLFLPLIPLALAMILSFLLIRISKLWKRREGMTTVISFAFVIGAMLLSMGSQSIGEEELQAMIFRLMLGQGSLTEVILLRYPPLQWAVNAMNTPGMAGLTQLLLFMGVSALAFAAVILLLGKGYLPLAARQAEALHRVNETRRKAADQSKQRSPMKALFLSEVKEVITVPSYATNCLMGVVMFPLMMVIILVAMQQESGMANLLARLATLIPRDFFLAGASAAMCLSCSMGIAVSTSVSREGKRHELRKTYPISGMVHLMSKLWMGMLYNGLSCLTIAIVLWAVLPGFWQETLLGFVISQLFSFLWCALALLLDASRPRLMWKTEMEAVKQNMNSFFSMLICLALLVVLVGAAWLCVKLGAGLQAGVAASVLLIAVGDGLSYFLLKKQGVKAYYLR